MTIHTDQFDQLLCADCLDACQSIPAASVHLVYLDPPFNTNAKRKTRDATYDDTFGSSVAYIAYLRPRIEQIRRALTPNGSLFFHCDWRMSHHVRLMLNEFFQTIDPSTGSGQAERQTTNSSRPSSVVRRQDRGVFVNEIVWHYGLGAAKARRHLLTKHDVIFWYANSRDYTFNLIREEPTEAMLAKYRHVDEHGNRYMMSYGKRYTLKGGKPLDDVWDIPAIAPTSSERAGYPTQKPLALLKRIVQLASNEGDAVLDPFCGSGTTLVAAQQLGRRWIGIDSNPQAIDIARGRLVLGSTV